VRQQREDENVPSALALTLTLSRRERGFDGQEEKQRGKG